MITGIINQTKTAKEDTEIASEKEVLEVSSINAMAKDRNGDVTKNNLDIELDKNIGNGKYESTEIEEGIVVTFTESDRSYLVDVDGKVESFDIVKDTTPWELAGSGTEEDPYLIESIEDLVQFSNEVNQTSTKFESKYIKLAVTLDFNSELSYCDATTKVSEKTNRIIEKDDNGVEIKTLLTSGIGFNPISFSGIFDGNQKEVRNLYINRPDEDYVGLFGKSWNIEIRELGVSGNVIGKQYVAGIIGYAEVVNMSYCFNKATINGDDLTAGIIGIVHGDNSSINSCYNMGKVNGKGTVRSSYASTGGITGLMTDFAKITNSYNGENVEAETYGIGGICGYHIGEIYNCANIGNITGKKGGNTYASVGGIVGEKMSLEPEPPKIINSFNWGNIKNEDTGNFEKKGGIIGKIDADKEYKIENNYYLKNTAIGGIDSKDIEGQAEALEFSEMPKVIDVIQDQIEIDNEMVNVWKEDTENINNGYPILYWQ